MAQAIQLIRGYPWLAGPAHFLQRLGGNLGSYPDALDNFWAFDFGSRVGGRFLLANVFGTFDVFRYRKFRGYRAGGEISKWCS